MAIANINQQSLASMTKFKLIDDEIYERRILYRFSTEFSREPWQSTQYAGWVDSEAGRWAAQNVKDLGITMREDFSTLFTHCAVVGYVSGKRWTEYCLKYIDKQYT